MNGIENSNGCCLCCCGPIQPRVNAMRKDQLGVRAVLYISAEASRNKSDWNCLEDPKVVDEFNGLHIFHESNTLPVLKSFADGQAKVLWQGENTPLYDPNFFSADGKPNTAAELKKRLPNFPSSVLPSKEVIPLNILFFSTIKEDRYRAAFWKAPTPIEEFQNVTDLVTECVFDAGNCKLPIIFEQTVPGCKSCNDIMTQEATTAHLMVRRKDSLVPLESILSVELSGKAKDDNLKPLKNIRYDPTERSKGGNPEAYTYQACLANYIHSCMPTHAYVNERVPERNPKNTKSVHTILATLSFLFLQISTLTFERYNGSQGGKKRNTKPDYRYRGCTEMYLSYIFWLLLCIDKVDGAGQRERGIHCFVEFVQFHRYFFMDFIKVIVLAESKYAGFVEIMDVVFGGDVLQSINTPPKDRIAHMCDRIPDFYKKIIRPLFSRHLAGMQPDPELLRTGHTDEDAIKYNNQTLVYNMLIDKTAYYNVQHCMKKVILDEIDTYMDEMGVHAVLNRWLNMMELAPKSTERLVQSFVDNQMLQEYTNIQMFMRPDSFQPTISPEAAETIYTMCNALELPFEPSTKEQLELLRVAPKCSEMKSIERLGRVGAFRRSELREMAEQV